MTFVRHTAHTAPRALRSYRLFGDGRIRSIRADSLRNRARRNGWTYSGTHVIGTRRARVYETPDGRTVYAALI